MTQYLVAELVPRKMHVGSNFDIYVNLFFATCYKKAPGKYKYWTSFFDPISSLDIHRKAMYKYWTRIYMGQPASPWVLATAAGRFRRSHVWIFPHRAWLKVWWVDYVKCKAVSTVMRCSGHTQVEQDIHMSGICGNSWGNSYVWCLKIHMSLLSIILSIYRCRFIDEEKKLVSFNYYQ